MHDFRELRRLIDSDTLMASGVGKVATLQAKGRYGVDTNTRRDALYGFLNEITARARTASEKKLPTIRAEGFEAAVEKVIATTRPDECDFMLLVLVTRELVQQRSFFGKLAQAVDWAEPTEDQRCRALVDTFISDVLANSETLQDLIGLQPNLGAALAALVDLAQGQMATAGEGRPSDSPEALAGRLNSLISGKGLPDSQAMLVERIRRQIEAKSPLTRGEPEQEEEAFRSLIGKLMPEDELFGGGSIAEALTHRQSRLLNKGGVAGLKEATGRLLPTLADPARKAAYLLALSESRLASTIGDEISQQLEGLFVRPESVREIVKDSRPPNKKMQTITAVFHKVRESTLEDGLKYRITGRLDELLASYIVDDRILERVDEPEPSAARARLHAARDVHAGDAARRQGVAAGPQDRGQAPQAAEFRGRTGGGGAGPGKGADPARLSRPALPLRVHGVAARRPVTGRKGCAAASRRAAARRSGSRSRGRGALPAGAG